jgi:hypothetical protein
MTACGYTFTVTASTAVPPGALVAARASRVWFERNPDIPHAMSFALDGRPQAPGESADQNPLSAAIGGPGPVHAFVFLATDHRQPTPAGRVT